jgi:hypothetical protein
MLFTRPAEPIMMSIDDFINVPMSTLSFLSQKIEANETILVEEDSHPLNWDRLRDANDDYDSILFYPEREIVLKDGEYALGMPQP